MSCLRLIRLLPRGRVTRLITLALLAPAAACAPASTPGATRPALAPSPIPSTLTYAPPTEVLLTQEPLPVEPMPIRFRAEDGQELVGLFYPPAQSPSPVVVLMHWIRSDASDWSAVARWLQNRLPATAPPPGSPPWLDASWFPEPGFSQGYAVFTFTFRGCQGGCKGFEPQAWLLDARAALQAAAAQPGVDPMQVTAVGASIGGDGAIDACAWLSDLSSTSRCLGALSLSPGGYLGVPYADAVRDLVAALDQAGALPQAEVAICLTSEDDRDSVQACGSVVSPDYHVLTYPGRAHGMELITPSLEPNPLSVVAGFLAGVTRR